MAKREVDNDKKQGSNTMLIVGLAGGGLLLLTCCCGAGVGGFFLWPRGPGAGIGGLGKTDIVGRWENNEIARLILDLKADGTAPSRSQAKVRIRITHQLQGNELRIAPARRAKRRVSANETQSIASSIMRVTHRQRHCDGGARRTRAGPVRCSEKNWLRES